LPRWLAARLRFGPVPLPGEWHTLDVAGFRLRGDGYGVIEIPSARFIVDLSSPDASRLVLPLGQSGQLFDRHAHDQLQAWSTGHDFPLPYTAKAVDAAAISTLRLIRAD
jgi:penicillin amidase